MESASGVWAPPEPPACPSWCEQEAGHPYESVLPDQDVPIYLRSHEIELDEGVTVVANEYADSKSVHISSPSIGCYGQLEGTDLDAATARRIAAALLNAADRLDECEAAE